MPTNAIFSILMIAALVPGLAFSPPRGADIVNHWARLVVLASPSSDPLRQLYEIRWGIIPNLGLDLLAWPFLKVFSAESIIRTGWVLAVLLPAAGAWALHRCYFRETKPSMLLVPIVSFNLPMTYGLLNFSMGVGLALLGAAAWLRTDSWPTLARIIMFNALSAICFFCHLTSFAILGVLIGLFEIQAGTALGWRPLAARLIKAGLCLAAGPLLWAVTEPIENQFGFSSPKSAILYAPFLTGVVLSDAVALSALLFAGVFAFRHGHLRLAKAARPSVYVFAAITLAMPTTLAAGSLVDLRLAVVLVLLCLAGQDWILNPKLEKVFKSIISLAALVRIALLVPAGHAFANSAVVMRELIVPIEPGQSVLVTKPPVTVCGSLDLDIAQHLANFIVIDRHAAASTLFTGQGMQPIRLRVRPDGVEWSAIPFDRLQVGASDASSASSSTPVRNWQSRFDALLLLHGDCEWRPPADQFRVVRTSAVATLYGTRNVSSRLPSP